MLNDELVADTMNWWQMIWLSASFLEILSSEARGVVLGSVVSTGDTHAEGERIIVRHGTEKGLLCVTEHLFVRRGTWLTHLYHCR